MKPDAPGENVGGPVSLAQQSYRTNIDEPRRIEGAALSILTLYQEELRAMVRGRFAWLGAGAVLLGLGGLAAIASQDTWLDGYGVIAYFLAPMTFLPLAAGSLASPRANRFVESVFTAPVERRDWFVAKVLVVLTLAIAYYAALIPMMLVYVAHVGMPLLLAKFLVWTPGILLVSVAVGTLTGVMFISRSVAAPVATGVGVMLVFAVLVPLQELLVARGYGATASGHVVLVSPFALLKNGLGFTLAVGWLPTSTGLTWLSFFVVLVGAFALAGWIFLRAQGVESWEATLGQRWSIAAGILVLILFPVLLGDTNYDTAAPAPNNAPDIPGLFLRGGGSLALVDPGAAAPAMCCDTLLNRDRWPSFPIDAATRQDLLLFLPLDATTRPTELDIEITGQNGLQVAVDPNDLAQAIHRLEKYTYKHGLGPAGADGLRINEGWFARVPVQLTPTNPWDIGGVRYPIDVKASYRSAGDGQPQTLTMRGAIEAQVASAIYEMSAAAALFPLLCFFTAFRRWRRTR
jgi:hypothetical protein